MFGDADLPQIQVVLQVRINNRTILATALSSINGRT
jgi:hypothetical protein